MIGGERKEYFNGTTKLNTRRIIFYNVYVLQEDTFNELSLKLNNKQALQPKITIN